MFGGTFDPVHKGHTDLARFVLERHIADRILFVPAPNPPHKTEQVISPYAVRRDLLKTALQGMAQTEISDIECERAGRSYSIDTLNLLRKRYPDDRIMLLIGADSLASLHTWFHAEEIVKNYTVLTYPRPGIHVNTEVLCRHWGKAETEKLISGILTDAPVFPYSSSEIRNGAGSDALHPEVWKKIQQQRLYQ